MAKTIGSIFTGKPSQMANECIKKKVQLNLYSEKSMIKAS